MIVKFLRLIYECEMYKKKKKKTVDKLKVEYV